MIHTIFILYLSIYIMFVKDLTIANWLANLKVSIAMIRRPCVLVRRPQV